MKWQIDPAHSSLTVGVRHMMVTTVRGRFAGVRGTVTLDPADPTGGSVDLAVDAATIDTGVAMRDDHLRSADFFDAKAYPEIRFRSTRVVAAADGTLRVEGDLTIREVTRPIVASGRIEGVWDDAKAGKRAGLSGTSAIDRREWGLVWNQPVANGGLLVGETVKVELELSIVPAAAARAA